MKNKNGYEPEPIDTSGVVLNEKILAVAEELARNTHEVWASGRMAEGWRFGEKLDGDRKEHPSLVPYDMLSEAEKDYDRRTAIETIKVLTTFGFTFNAPSEKS